MDSLNEAITELKKSYIGAAVALAEELTRMKMAVPPLPANTPLRKGQARIGAFPYTISHVDKIRDEDGIELVSDTDHAQLKILLAKDAAPQYRTWALWRELLQTIYIQSGHAAESIDEGAWDALAAGVMRIVQYNYLSIDPRPTRIVLHPFIYPIERVFELRNNDGDRIDGQIVYSKQLIRLDEDLCEAVERRVLWELILCIILDQTGHDGALDSFDLRALASGLTALLAGNLHYEV